MPVIAFAHYNLTASRELMEQLKTFYCGILDLKIGYRPPLERPGYWLYLGEQALLHLIENKPDEPRTPHLRGTIDHMAFSCSDVAAMEERLNQHHIPYRISYVPVSGETQLFCHDPAGNGVEFNFAPAPA